MAVYKKYTKTGTTYQRIIKNNHGEFQIRYNVSATNPNGVYTPNTYDTFRDAEKALYKYYPGTKRIA